MVSRVGEGVTKSETIRASIVERLKAPHSFEIKNFYDPVLPYLPTFLRNEAIKTANTSPLLCTLADFSLDYGIAQEKQFQESTAPKVAMLNRSAFISHLLKVYKKSPNEAPKSFSAKILDIAKFRKADQAIDVGGNHAADYNVNMIAAKMNERVMAINRVLSDHGIHGYVMPCRYGGDEFGVAIIGVDDKALYDEIYSAIIGGGSEADNGYRDGIADIMGYMKVGTKIVAKKIRLKPESILKEIDIPEDAQKQEKFWEQMERGMLLDKDEIQAVINDEKTNGGIEPTGRKDTINKHGTFKDYLNALEELHPELSNSLAVVRSFSEGADVALAQAVRAEFPDFVKNIVYDRLLGDRVTPFADLVKHLQNNAFSDVFVYDMKGIKEFNDIQSVATGDRAIMALLWNTINISLNDADRKNIMIFRRGSTFVVGVRKSCTNDLKSKLEKIQTVKFQDDTHVVGYHQAPVTEIYSKDAQGKQKAAEYLTNIINSADIAWMKRIIGDYLLPEPDILKIEEVSHGARLDFRQGMGLYFNGPRAMERMGRLLDAIGVFAARRGDPRLGKLKEVLSAQVVKAVEREIKTTLVTADEDDKEELIFALGKLADKTHVLNIPGHPDTDSAIATLLQQVI